ncbi:hypothetical protein SKAU_G00255500 [Synaphobranchus kaupii]|uniref:Uncharacterized protein n=1 Tax=Synaphobranchus kaupii TaxID=118154 RepID=A0A9Q1ISA2_SYNKA|nr:hypothetical protein SKAU_G00255500 [Synaphobranchus kaupii]
MLRPSFVRTAVTKLGCMLRDNLGKRGVGFNLAAEGVWQRGSEECLPRTMGVQGRNEPGNPGQLLGYSHLCPSEVLWSWLADDNVLRLSQSRNVKVM